MRRVLFVAGAFLSFLAPGVSRGADLPILDVAPAWTYYWSGFYVGILGGYGSGNTSSNVYNISDGAFELHTSLNREGGFGGLEIGYNFAVTPNWLIGIEADASAAAINGSLFSCASSGCSQTDSSANAIATVRGRLGYTWNNLLLFGTGGAAFVETDNNRTIVLSPKVPALEGQTANSSSGSVGWSAGGGIEYAFTSNISAKIEYLFIDYNSTHDYYYSDIRGDRHVTSETQIDTVRAALAYHFNSVPVPLK